MRKISVILFAFCALFSFAERISEKDAISFAVSYHQSQYSNLRKNENRTISSFDSIESILPYGNLYVINFREGWMIMPTNNAMTPILAYSPTGDFDMDDIPEALDDLLQHYSKCVELCSDSIIHPRWAIMSNQTSSSSVVIDRMRNVKWGQSENNEKTCTNAYNAQCPTYSTLRCDHNLVGCGPICLGQIMWYNNWPHCAIVPETMLDSHGHTSGSVLHTYDWDVIPTELYDSTNIHSWHELTGLLRDCGYVSHPEYEEKVTNTNLRPLRKAFETMQYTTDDHWIFLSGTSAINKIKQDITQNRPVVLVGLKSQNGSLSGHYFTVYGYTSDDRYYINWGWTGSYMDATYAIDSLDGYDYFNMALCNIRPNIPCDVIEFSHANIDEDFYRVSSDTIFCRDLTITGDGNGVIYSGTAIVLESDVEINSNVEIDIIDLLCVDN